MAVEKSELELVWPADIFVAEARILLATMRNSRNRLGFLMAEAFHDDRGFRLFEEVEATTPSWPADDDPWAGPGARATAWPTSGARLVAELVDGVDTLPRFVPRRYYSARRNPPPESALPLPEVKIEFAREVAALVRGGYFDEAFGSSCVDADADPAAEGQRRLASLLDTSLPLWPLVDVEGRLTGLEKDWSEDVLFDVIEALHDVVSRPRERCWHAFGNDWDYQDFARGPGQAVYRWRVNALLSRSEIELRLAESGGDVGRLVHSAGASRDELVKRALGSPDPDVRDDVGHASMLFRGRTATVADRRSAVVVLAGALERRRRLLKEELFKKDEGALFQIANEFDVRHRDKSQQSDYDPVFLDWLFWWYLATVELTDRLLARQSDAW